MNRQRLRFRLIGVVACLLLSLSGAEGHYLGPNSTDYYTRIMLTPDEIRVMIDVHLGEIPTASLAVRMDLNRDGTLEPEEVSRYAQTFVPVCLKKIVVRIKAGDNTTIELPLRYLRMDDWNDEAAYIVPGESGMQTYRMRITAAASWPESVRSRPGEPVMAFVVIQGSSGGSSSTMTVRPAAAPLKVFECDAPLDVESPLPPDLIPAVQDATKVPKRSVVRIEFCLDGSKAPASRPMATPEGDASAARAGSEDLAAGVTGGKGRPQTESRLRVKVLAMLRGAKGPGSWLLAILFSFFWGVMDAFTPGHGKAMASAYLVGTGARTRHALILAGLVTLTHTAVVIVVALVALMLEDRFSFPTWLEPVGIAMIMLVGLNQIRIGLMRMLRGQGDTHHHHSHLPAPKQINSADLAMIGMSGGLVPCPSAIILLLLALQLREPLLGVACLISFSMGLGGTLISIGFMAVSGAKVAIRWLSKKDGSGASRVSAWVSAWLPILGGMALLLVGGLLMKVFLSK